jgi:hypothetical protein
VYIFEETWLEKMLNRGGTPCCSQNAGASRGAEESNNEKKYVFLLVDEVKTIISELLSVSASRR